MWLTKAHTSQEAPTSTSGSCSLVLLFLIGCGKEKSEINNSASNEIKEEKNFDNRPKIELIDIDFQGKVVKQIIIVNADEEEQDKLFEKASKSLKDLIDYFPDYFADMNTEDKDFYYSYFSDLKNKSKENADNNQNYTDEKFDLNTSNSFYFFLRNNKELREYIPEDEIKTLFENIRKTDKKTYTIYTHIEKFNKKLREKQGLENI
ncbi:hypothetical protein [Fusobacterium animalis]|uniref:hypothetical protein n=1 Tax=Fusobacterium animalis TaxID=76859 RepID=UPI0030CF3A94